jgi:DNA-binding HxlR family transcriptional regulator
MQVTDKTGRKRPSSSRRDKRATAQIHHLRSPCPIANLLDLAGDKWSFLVVRDLMRGRSTFNELLASPERIPTNLLADRLKRLEKSGVLVRTPYQQRPVRYAYKLTRKGRDLRDVLNAVVRWSEKHLPGVRTFADIDSNARRR